MIDNTLNRFDINYIRKEHKRLVAEESNIKSKIDNLDIIKYKHNIKILHYIFEILLQHIDPDDQLPSSYIDEIFNFGKVDFTTVSEAKESTERVQAAINVAIGRLL